jgi:hypothetical protein
MSSSSAAAWYITTELPRADIGRRGSIHLLPDILNPPFFGCLLYCTSFNINHYISNKGLISFFS